MQPSRLLVTAALLGGQIVLALPSCGNLTGLQGVADVEPWILTSAAVDTLDDGTTYCNVSGAIAGRIRTWMLLPTQDAWNGRFVQIGCGGACGYNPFENTYFAITEALRNGSALSTTDMGEDEKGSQ